MRIFLIGSGGREHAIAWKILQSPKLTELYLNATNASSESLKLKYPEKSITFVNISEKNIDQLVQFSVENKINLAIIGSEAPLSMGLSDQLRQKNIAVFGPSQLAAEIETSKAFAKDFMRRHDIPTAKYKVFSDYSEAIRYIKSIDYPIVIKASGLASGKGVFLPEDKLTAEKILDRLLNKKELGDSSKEIIIEERLEGQEISLLAFTDGMTVKSMPLARDHKRLLAGNTGPNTGGMGAYAPVILPANFKIDEFISKILIPTIQGLREENRLFTGVIYAGLMLTSQGVKVLEFNCRFGDPETQVLLPLLSTDLIDIIEACISGSLSQSNIIWKNQAAVCVVLASEKYPEANNTEQVITGLSENITDTHVFHAGTSLKNNIVYASGGRILGVTAWADHLEAALQKSYQRVNQIEFTGMQYRLDIGK